MYTTLKLLHTSERNQIYAHKKPGVGVGVIVIYNDKVLFGKRKNILGEGMWGFPGGRLEYGESWEECARREVMEEAGITIKNLRFATATNNVFINEDVHYVTIFMLAEYATGTLRVMEPEKCEEWRWSSWNDPPQPLFCPNDNPIHSGYNPFYK